MYEVRKNGWDWELVSIVPVPVQILPGGTRWGGTDAVNYVCSGSKEYCEEIKARLEGQ